MDLELSRNSFDAYTVTGELALSQEETAETIVPDYCPDIARIIETEGSIFIHSRDLREGKAEVAGTVRVTVLYTPESESGGIRTLEFAIPFNVESDGRALPGCQSITAETDTEFLETRMINPRKIFTHCKLITRICGYQRTPLHVCADVIAEPRLCVEKRQEQQHAILLTHMLEKDFTFSEELDLSPGRDGAAEILTSRIGHTVTETKIVGNKLIFKGLFTLHLLYRTAEEECGAASGELPFSQIMEVEDTAEGCAVSLRLQCTGTDIQIDGADPEGRQIAVTLYMHATAFLWENQDLVLLNDLYSTAYPLTYDAAPISVTGYLDHMTRRQTVREVLEIGVVAESILSLSVTCGSILVSREGSVSILHTNATVKALYFDEGGVPLIAERCIDVNCQVDLPEGCTVNARALCPDEIQGSLGDRGIEVRFPVDFHIEATNTNQKICITAARLDTEAVKDMTGAPSLVLRCMNQQESAWELAKRYNTTIAAILAANQLESEENIPIDKLLLIPRKRA